MKKAKWVWADIPQGVNQYVEFYLDFHACEQEKYFLHISVTGNYCIEVNGAVVACARFDDFPERKLYDDVELTPFVRSGENQVKILAYGFHLGTYRSLPMPPALIAELLTEQGEVVWYTKQGVTCAVSPYYKSGEVPKFAAGNQYTVELFPCPEEEATRGACTEVNLGYPLYERPIKRTEIGETLPSRLVAQGVFTVGDETDASKKLYRANLSTKPLFEICDLYEAPVFPVKDGVAFERKGEQLYFVFDLLAEQNGYLQFDFTLKEDTLIEVAYGEHLDDLRVRCDIGERKFVSVIHGKKGENVFTDYINRFGLRYIQMHVYADYCKIQYLGLKYTYYPVEKLAWNTSNALRKKIYDVSVKTLQECMHEHYEDCPYREQALYAMDSRNQMLCGYYAFGEFAFAKESIELLFTRIRDDGHMYLTAPCDRMTTIPCFTLVAFLIVKEYVEHSKDLSLAEKLWEKLTFILEKFLFYRGENGLLVRFTNQVGVWNFYEWTQGMWNDWGDHPLAEGSVEYPSVLNAFFVIALDSYCWLGRALGVETSDYEGILEKIKEDMDTLFWSEKEGCYAAYCTDGELTHFNELANAMMLYIGVGGEKRRTLVADKLKSGKLSEMTLSMMIYKYQALIDFDKINTEYVLTDIDEKWGHMLFHGATTFWETLKGADDFGGAGSLCHGWSAIPAYFYWRYLK